MRSQTCEKWNYEKNTLIQEVTSSGAWQWTRVSLKDRSWRSAQLTLQRSWLKSPKSDWIPGQPAHPASYYLAACLRPPGQPSVWPPVRKPQQSQWQGTTHCLSPSLRRVTSRRAHSNERIKLVRRSSGQLRANKRYWRIPTIPSSTANQ